MRVLRLAYAILLFSSISAQAAVISGSTPGGAGLFGNLNQNDTNCGVGGSEGCGPTAAVNSFIMLQNKYPTIYGTNLVPAGQAVNVANTLGTGNYMDCAACGGTYIENFIFGKQKYIEEKVPGKTVYKAYVAPGFAWRNDPGGVTPGYNNGGQPGYVTRAAPPVQWLADELNHGEDLEIYVGYNAGGAHYLTLHSIMFDTATNMGTIGFIDPLTGAAGNANITGLAGGFLTLSYGGGSTLFHAVSESPIPEPGTWVLLSLGTATLLLRRRKKAA